MWRRIPVVPMLFGAFASLALVSMLAIGGVAPSDWHAYRGAAAVGAAYFLLLYVLVSLFSPRLRSTAATIGCGCLYAAAGYLFLGFTALAIAVSNASNFAITNSADAFASLIAFAGLGILGGMTLARFRRSEAARQQAALEAQAAEFAREQLEIARDLQQRLLPPAALETDRYRLTARNVPAAYVAGDFYDFIPLGPDRLLIVLADVAGKGVGAGLIMATVKAMVPFLAAEQAQPAPLLGRLNEKLAGQLAQREFVAMIVALYDAQVGTLTIANAGLPDPVVLPSLRPIAAEGPRYPIGIRKSLSYESVVVNVAPGDRVILFTDGLAEATVAGEPLGYERLSIELKRAQGEIPRLFAALEDLGAAHDDDWTAVLLERLR